MQLPSIFCSCCEVYDRFKSLKFVVALTVAIHSQTPWNPWRTFPFALEAVLKAAKANSGSEVTWSKVEGLALRSLGRSVFVLFCFILFCFVFVRVVVFVFMFVCVFGACSCACVCFLFCVCVCVCVCFLFLYDVVVVVAAVVIVLFNVGDDVERYCIWLLIGRLDVVWNTV